jgi:hypothetical protein
LGKIHKCAARDEGNNRPHGEQNGAEQQQHRHSLAFEQAPTKGEIRPGQRGDQGAPETREDEEQVEEDEGTDDTLEYNGKRVPKDFARLGQNKKGTLGPAALGRRVEAEQVPGLGAGALESRFHSAVTPAAGSDGAFTRVEVALRYTGSSEGSWSPPVTCSHCEHIEGQRVSPITVRKSPCDGCEPLESFGLCKYRQSSCQWCRAH